MRVDAQRAEELVDRDCRGLGTSRPGYRQKADGEINFELAGQSYAPSIEYGAPDHRLEHV
jgi:hypothetical protein